MTVDDDAARRERARRLRATIKEIVLERQDSAAPDNVTEEPVKRPDESPREFIERKMREQNDAKRS
jgi:hypothetical protein